MSTTVDVSVQRTGQRISAAAVATWAAWAIMVLLGALFIAGHGLNIPRQDEWGTFPQLIGREPITLNWLWSFQNEHRIPLQRVLYLGAIRAAGMDFRAGMVLNLAMLASAAALFLVAARRLRGRSSWVDLAFPALFLHVGQYENYLNSFQIQFVAGVLLTTGIAVQFLLLGDKPRWLRVAGIGACMLLLPLDGGTTLVFIPPLMLWIAIAALLAWRQGSAGWIRTAAAGLFVLACGAGICLAYFQGFTPATRPAFSLAGLVRGITEFAGTACGPGCTLLSWAAAGGLMLALCLLTVLVLLGKLRRDPASRARTLGLLAILGGFGLMIGSIGYGRGMVAPLWGTSPRYAGLLAPGLGLCILVLSLQPARILRYCGAAAALLVLLAVIPNSQAGMEGARRQDALYAALERDVAARLPTEALAMRYGDFIYVTEVAFAEQCILDLQEHHLGPFAQVSSPLPRHPAGLIRVPISSRPTAHDMRYDEASGVWESTGPDPFLVYPLPGVIHVAGIHMNATIGRPSGMEQIGPYASTDYFWAQEPQEHFSATERHLQLRNTIGAELDQHIWLYGKANQFRIDPDTWPCRFTLRRMEVLAIPPDAETNALYQLAQVTSSTAGEPPYLVGENREDQQLVFYLPTTFHVNVRGKRSLTVDVSPWREETFRRVRLHVSGPGVEVEHLYIPNKTDGPQQIPLPPGATEIDVEFSSRQPPGEVRAALSRFELK